MRILPFSSLGSIECENIDVFCEKGIFECDQTERILEAGRQIGLQLNFHAEELNYIGGAEVNLEKLIKILQNIFFFLFLARSSTKSKGDEPFGRNFRHWNFGDGRIRNGCSFIADDGFHAEIEATASAKNDRSRLHCCPRK